MPKKPQKKKFFNIEVPLINENYEVQAYLLEDLNNKTMKFDMTRKLKGKSLDLVFTIKVKDDKATTIPKKLRLMPFFIKHMLRKRISYIEDSIKAQTKENNIIIKPFLITRKKVSRAVRKTLRNSAKNWIEDNCKTLTNTQLFEDILQGKFQRELSIKLKKIYPLSLCEVRILEIKTPLEKSEKETKETQKQSTKTKESKPLTKDAVEIPDKKSTSKKTPKQEEKEE